MLSQRSGWRSRSESERKVNRWRASRRSLSESRLRSYRQAILTIRRELHERLLLRNEQTKQVLLPEVYIEHDNAKKNVMTWMNSQFITDAASKIEDVRHSPRSRVNEDDRLIRYPADD